MSSFIQSTNYSYSKKVQMLWKLQLAAYKKNLATASDTQHTPYYSRQLGACIMLISAALLLTGPAPHLLIAYYGIIACLATIAAAQWDKRRPNNAKIQKTIVDIASLTSFSYLLLILGKISMSFLLLVLGNTSMIPSSIPIVLSVLLCMLPYLHFFVNRKNTEKKSQLITIWLLRDGAQWSLFLLLYLQPMYFPWHAMVIPFPLLVASITATTWLIAMKNKPAFRQRRDRQRELTAFLGINTLATIGVWLGIASWISSIPALQCMALCAGSQIISGIAYLILSHWNALFQMNSMINNHGSPRNLHYSLCYCLPVHCVALLLQILQIERLCTHPNIYAQGIKQHIHYLSTRLWHSVYLYIINPIQMWYQPHNTVVQDFCSYRKTAQTKIITLKSDAQAALSFQTPTNATIVTEWEQATPIKTSHTAHYTTTYLPLLPA